MRCLGGEVGRFSYSRLYFDVRNGSVELRLFRAVGCCILLLLVVGTIEANKTDVSYLNSRLKLNTRISLDGFAVDSDEEELRSLCSLLSKDTG
jgi:hypothetical protein